MSDFENTTSSDEVVAEETDTSVAEDFSPDYSSLNSSLNETQETEEDNSGTPAKNPAWDPILNLIPEQLHSQVIPHLSKTDKRVQELQQKYAPYKSFAEQGIDPETINQTLTLGRMIAENPQAVYDQMRVQYNLSHEEALDAMQEATDEYGDDESQGLEYGDAEDSDYSGEAIESHPLVQQLQAQVQELAEAREQQRIEQLQTQIANDVMAEWQEVEKVAGGALPEGIKDDIMTRALQLAGDNGMPNLMDGFKAHVKFASQIRNSSANNSAPPVADGTGLLPSSRTYDKSSKEGMEAFIADAVRSLNGGK